MSTSESHRRSFPNPGQWVWCVNIATGSTRMQTIPDALEKDVTSWNQTHAPKKRRGRMPCAYSLKLLALWTFVRGKKLCVLPLFVCIGGNYSVRQQTGLFLSRWVNLTELEKLYYQLFTISRSCSYSCAGRVLVDSTFFVSLCPL